MNIQKYCTQQPLITYFVPRNFDTIQHNNFIRNGSNISYTTNIPDQIVHASFLVKPEYTENYATSTSYNNENFEE